MPREPQRRSSRRAAIGNLRAPRLAPLVVRLGALLLTSSALVGAPALAKPGAKAQVAPKLDIKSWTLANGLQVLFLADHKAPIATVQVFYHVGSKDEHVGIRGVAHMFEHMMFKGSEHVPPEEHARLLKEVGGQTNAFTTEDLTAYHDTVPPADVGFPMGLQADGLRHPPLLPETARPGAQPHRERAPCACRPSGYASCLRAGDGRTTEARARRWPRTPARSRRRAAASAKSLGWRMRSASSSMAKPTYAGGTVSWYAVRSSVVKAFVCPPTSLSRRACCSGGTRSEPLNIMCSNMCATPRMPTCSSFEPT